MAAQVFVAPFIAPLFLTIGWSGATGVGVVSGECNTLTGNRNHIKLTLDTVSLIVIEIQRVGVLGPYFSKAQINRYVCCEFMV